MANKFIASIAAGGDAVRLQRATLVANTAKLAQEALINECRTKVQELDNALNNLLDLAPETTDSLRPAGNGFKPHQWVQQVQELKVARKKAVEHLDIAVGTYNDWFVELGEQIQTVRA